MRIILLNPYEFDSTDSEEVVGVAYAPMSEHPSDDAFIKEIANSTRRFSFPADLTCQDNTRYERSITRHLLNCIQLATNWRFERSAVTRTCIISDDWNDKSALFEIDGTRFWACWFTTA